MFICVMWFGMRCYYIEKCLKNYTHLSIFLRECMTSRRTEGALPSFYDIWLLITEMRGNVRTVGIAHKFNRKIPSIR
jgi:hypothetical protein